jgi:hypothetical protein
LFQSTVVILICQVEARIVCDTKVGNKKGEERRGG